MNPTKQLMQQHQMYGGFRRRLSSADRDYLTGIGLSNTRNKSFSQKVFEEDADEECYDDFDMHDTHNYTDSMQEWQQYYDNMRKMFDADDFENLVD